jgi:hypothetical protein
MSTRSAMRLLVAGAILVAMVVPTDAALITLSSRSLFDAAAPGLPVETFEAGLVTPGGVTVCNGPLTGAAASACFPAGGLLPGVTYSAAPGSGLALLGAGFPAVGNTSKVLGPNGFADTFNLAFASATAIGFDVFAGLVPGNVTMSIFDLANLPLGTFTVAVPAGGAFFGVLSDAALIGRINVASQTTIPGELVDNVAFGTAASVVPEPTTVALVGLGLTALVFRRRQPTSAVLNRRESSGE